MTSKLRNMNYVLISVVSAVALSALLFLRPSLFALIFFIATAVTLIIISLKHKILYDTFKSKIKLKESIISILISLFIAVKFVDSWRQSTLLNQVCLNTIVKYGILFLNTLILSAFAIFMIYSFVSIYSSFFQEQRITKSFDDNLTIKYSHVIFLLIIACITITICSKSSPIYPLNDWGDANCFFTVGKSVANGYVPYRDIYEQKGPLLYFIHTAAYCVSANTFLGMYFIELAACFIFLFFSYKTMRLYENEKIILFMPIVSAIVYSSSAFAHGDSAEELCMPLISYCLYIGAKAIKLNKDLNFLESLFIGITSGMILWIKFTILGFFIGFFIAMLIIYIKAHRVKILIKSVSYIVIGVLISSLPILIYFAANNALYDLFKVYIYDNIFSYGNNTEQNLIISLFINLVKGSVHIVSKMYIGIIGIILGLVFFILNRNKKMILYLSSTVLFTLFFTYLGGRFYRYYALIFSVFVPFAAICLYDFLRNFLRLNHINKNKKSHHKKALCLCLCLLSIDIMLFCSNNVYLLKYSKDDLPQYKFDKIISQTKNPTLLDYGHLDSGFYTVSNIVPSCKYFCKLNIANPDIENTQKYYIENGMIDFIVTKDNKPTFDLYDCVYETEFYYEESNHKYYLYKLR